MRSAERAQEVVKRLFVGQVDYRKTKAPFVTIAMEQIVVADGEVEQVARRNARRILVVVFRAICRNRNAVGPGAGRNGPATRGSVAQRRRERPKDPLPTRPGAK